MQLMPLVLTLREDMNVAAILDTLEMAQYAVNVYNYHNNDVGCKYFLQ